TGGEFPSTAARPEFGQDRGIRKLLSRAFELPVEFATSVNTRATRPKCSEVVTRCHLSVSDEANGIWSEDTACCQESRTFPSLTIFGKVPGCEASKNRDFALSSMRHRASFSGKSSRSRPDGTWWQLRYPWAIKDRSRVDTVIALG